VIAPAKRLPQRAGAALAFLAAVVALAAAGPAAAANGAKVSILDSGFKPAIVTVKQWQAVTWTNDGKAKHGVVSDSGPTLASGALDPGQAYANVFTRAGTFAYHDSEHPSLAAKVVVVAAPKPTVTGATPPSGRKPKGFHPKPTFTTATPVTPSSGGGTDWGAIGGGIGAAAALLASALLVARRRRGARG
jgi:plastocyanin